MERKWRLALAEINERFYRRQAAEFSGSRGRPWPGWERVLDRVVGSWTGSSEGNAPSAASPPTEDGASRRALDVGCGNGRFGALLAQRFDAGKMSYVGVDGSGELLLDAESALEDLGWAQLRLLPWDWVTQDARLPGELSSGELSSEETMDLVVLFGSLHHVPGAELRRNLLLTLARQLAPGGWLVVSVWRFGEDARFRRRFLPWSKSGEITGVAVDERVLDPGDHLLAWGPLPQGDAGGQESPARYCHALQKPEEDRLLTELQELGLELVETFEDDGRGRQLNGYWMLRRRA
ncbi:MAG: class I SAM-dependent methyltransferase [Acidobacteriota bacterium]